MRMATLLTILATVDLYTTTYCVSHIIKNGKSVLILFGFEFGLLVISVFSLSFRYFLLCIDCARGDNNGWQYKVILLYIYIYIYILV
jgi:hypothetical protein